MFSALIVVLAGAIFGSLLGGPQLKQVDETVSAWNKAVKDSIEDNAKKDEAVALIGKIKEELPKRQAALSDAVKTYLKVDASYSASAEDYQAAIVVLNNVWTEEETWLVDRRFDVQALMTDAELTKALVIVNEELKEQWDTLKEAQQTLRANYSKRVKKVDKNK